MAQWESAPVVGNQPEWMNAPVIDAPATVNPNIRAQGLKMENARSGATEFLSQRDPGIDYSTGVNNTAFRAGFSRMTNDDEKANFLNRAVGSGQWDKDTFGAYYIKPEGAKRLGIKAVKPVSIDEQTTTRYDIADLAGDAPAIVGSTGMALAAFGAGAPAGRGLAGLGAAGGKAIDELVKRAQGLNLKSAGEQATSLLGEAAAGAAGEGVPRLLMPLTRFALGPAASRMTPEKEALAKAATDQGFKIRAGSVTDAPILARWEGMVRQIFGDLYAPQNRAAAQSGIDRLTGTAGQSVSREAAGESVARSVRAARVNFGSEMGKLYSQVDQLSGGQPIIPTGPIKAIAQELIEAMPKTTEGKVVGGKTAFINDILGMDDAITVTQAQRLRTMLREMAESNDLTPDISMHDARMLRNSVNDAFEKAKQSGASPAVNALRMADSKYAQGIKQFDNQVVTAITRDAGKPGAVDADMVVDYLLKPDRVVRLRRVKDIIPAAEWGKVKSSHAQELLSTVVQGTDDPLMSVFNGRALRDGLDKYGRNVLEEVHGKQWVDDAYKYANSLMLAEKRMAMSGNIVAANVALHPIKNLPRLVWIRGLAKAIEQPGTFKYLTSGFQPNATVKEATAAATRLASQVAALASDETGSARITLTAPEKEQ